MPFYHVSSHVSYNTPRGTCRLVLNGASLLSSSLQALTCKQTRMDRWADAISAEKLKYRMRMQKPSSSSGDEDELDDESGLERAAAPDSKPGSAAVSEERLRKRDHGAGAVP